MPESVPCGSIKLQIKLIFARENLEQKLYASSFICLRKEIISQNNQESEKEGHQQNNIIT